MLSGTTFSEPETCVNRIKNFCDNTLKNNLEILSTTDTTILQQIKIESEIDMCLLLLNFIRMQEMCKECN